MNASLIWVILPGVAGFVLFFLRRWKRLVNTLGILVALLLALCAWRVPIGEPIILGPWAWLPPLEISDTLVFQGRRLVLEEALRPALALIYLSAAIWFIGATAARASRPFVPIGLEIAALFTAALAVEPVLYAAMLIELAAIISMPLLAPPGKAVPRGVYRFLTFQTLGMPVLLLAGWQVSAIELNPTDQASIMRAAALLSLGLGIVMAVFPFNNWIPMLAEEAHVYVSAFIFFTLLVFSILLSSHLAAHYTWLQNLPTLTTFIRLAGLLTMVGMGATAAFQRDLGRIMGYSVASCIGLILVVLSLSIETGGLTTANEPLAASLPGQEAGRLLLGTFLAQILTTGLGLALWALSLSIIQSQAGGLRFRQVRGLARCLPFATAGMCIASLSLAGLPLLAGFQVRYLVIAELAQQSPINAALVMIGIAGLFTGTVRSLAVLVMSPEDQPCTIGESRWQVVLILGGCLALLLVGLFPRVFLPLPELMGAIFSGGK